MLSAGASSAVASCALSTIDSRSGSSSTPPPPRSHWPRDTAEAAVASTDRSALGEPLTAPRFPAEEPPPVLRAPSKSWRVALEARSPCTSSSFKVEGADEVSLGRGLGLEDGELTSRRGRRGGVPTARSTGLYRERSLCFAASSCDEMAWSTAE